MTRKERWQLLCTWFFLGLAPLFLKPLWEPDEARYAEVPREMLALGDWLTPRLNYVLYFEKPPLQYWLSAASMRLFGQHPFAARLPLALATLVSLWCAWRLAGRLGARRPAWAGFMAATAILAYVCGQILTLDALFAAFHVLAFTAAVEAVAARSRGERGLGWTLLAFGSLALAVLTKGLAAPVLVGMTVICSLPWAWAEPRLRRAVVRTLLDPLGWLLFLALSAPWFVLVDRAHPGHTSFFFLHEHFARFTSHVHAREGSKNPFLDKLYFLGVLGLGLVPWLAAAWTGLRRALGFLRAPGGPVTAQAPLHRWTVAAVLLAGAWPFFFYTVSGSKLPPYILPSMVPILALACAFEREGEERRALARCGRELLVLGVLLLLAGPFLLKDKSGVGWALAAGAGFAALGCWALRAKSDRAFRPWGLSGTRWMVGLGAVLLLLTVSAQKAAGAGKEESALVRRAPADAQWISCGNYYQVIPFLTGRRTVVVAGTGELAYGRDHLDPAERERWFQEDDRTFAAVGRRLRAEDPGRPVWALVDRNTWRGLEDSVRDAWEERGRTPSCILVTLK
ncbi:MAG: glycosyltransferase family 39 protein [Holophaga sp.]|jgi:4-amino-4-deoxy-L-arabinose transferase-like glycosyltransferase